MKRYLKHLRHLRHLQKHLPQGGYEWVLFVGALGLIFCGFIALWAASLKIPDPASLTERRVTQSAKIYDRTGTILLDDLGDNVTRTIVPLAQIAPNIQHATIATEDAEFYEHGGIKVTSIIRSVLVNILNLGYAQGGSTITQQVVKNSVLTKDKTISRKLKEWVLAVKLDHAMPKDKILEIYLNENPYGGAIYGVEEASQTFFGIHASDVSLAQAAYLAALPQAPTYYSPYGSHRDALDGRKSFVLSRMEELGYITEGERTQADKEVVQFATATSTGIKAPHFVFFVREQLEQEFGERALNESGWRIITTLDAALESTGEGIVKKYALENATKFNASNASLVALNPQTGDILAMVGSRDYFDKDIDGNVNIATAKRQPGSSFKPFVYAAAFAKGYSPDTVLFDVPTQFSTLCPAESTNDQSPCYYPENYDHVYRGPMSLRNALAQSINIVAVKVLYLVGISDALRVARALGITTLEGPDRYGLTLVLGGGEVTLLDLVSSYGVFANEGVRTPYRAVLKIEDATGATVKEYETAPQQVIDRAVALNVSDVLSDDAARIPAFGANSALNIAGHHVADKTGTTNDYKDAWIIGYSPTFVAGAWAGNNDNTPMEKKVAGFIVAPMWNEFMRAALVLYPDQPFPEPPPLLAATSKPILNGMWQGSDGITNVHTILYWLDKNNPTGARPENPANDPQFTRWEYGVRRWAQSHGYIDGSPLVPH